MSCEEAEAPARGFGLLLPIHPDQAVGNFLAHQRWMAHFGSHRLACWGYSQRLRQTALSRFGWHSHDLAVRESYALFRLATNPVRNMRADWEATLREVLVMAMEALEG